MSVCGQTDVYVSFCGQTMPQYLAQCLARKIHHICGMKERISVFFGGEGVKLGSVHCILCGEGPEEPVCLGWWVGIAEKK